MVAKLSKRATGLLWGELDVDLNLCTQLWALGFVFHPIYHESWEEKKETSISASFSVITFQMYSFLCLNILILAYSSPHPTYGLILPLHELMKLCCSKLKWKTRYPGDLSLMWNSILTWKSRNTNPKLFQNSYYKTDNQMPPNHSILYSINRTLTKLFGCICISK